MQSAAGDKLVRWVLSGMGEQLISELKSQEVFDGGENKQSRPGRKTSNLGREGKNHLA